jgi:two-component system OmpR family response regulator
MGAALTGVSSFQPDMIVAAAPLTVFMVEDSAPLRETFAELLATLPGFALAGMAGSEAQADQWLEDNDDAWNVAIVDLMLKGGSGFNLIPRLKAGGPGRTVIVYSGFVTPEVRQRCLALGADAVFQKSGTEGMLQYLVSLRRRRTSP